MKQHIRAHYPVAVREKKKTIIKQLRSEIVFGSPSTGCKGSGVCKVVPVLTTARDWKCPHATAWISVTPEGKLRVAFQKSSLTLRQIRCYFRWQLFQVFEPFQMPYYIQQKLNASQTLIIQPGIYPVLETADELIVEF
ncbi:MAG: hypothetical protein R3D58_17320 [Saprospiraceae bacterium]